MVAPTLADYEYMYKDTGLLLNGPTVLPFWDVDKISGLDMATISANIDDIDSRHGGTIYALYAQHRTIVVEGTLYANPSLIEAAIDLAVTNFFPDNSNYPFYFKHPGALQRYVSCKAIAFNSDTETMRRTGTGKFQLQLIAEDPRKYIDNANIVMVAATNYTPANTGNVETYPIFTIVGAFATITFTNMATAQSVTLTTPRIAGDITIVDFRTRSVTINGVQSSAVVTTSNWWSIPKGGGQNARYTVTGGPPTSVTMVTKQGWM